MAQDDAAQDDGAVTVETEAPDSTPTPDAEHGTAQVDGLESKPLAQLETDEVKDQGSDSGIMESRAPNSVPESDAEQSMDAPVENEEKTVTRIDWIHELAERFYIDPENSSNLDEVRFSDFSPSEEFYQDAVWAWNVGLFENNEEMSIRPFEPATHEFTAYTLSSCLDLGLGDGDASTYSIAKNAAISEEMQIALNRDWFDEDNASPDEDVEPDEAGVMLSDAEDIVALGEVQEGYANKYEYADGVIEVPEDIEFEISSDETTVTLYSDELSIEAGDDFVVYLDSLPIAYTALEVFRENGNTTITVKKAEATVFEYVDAQGTIPLTEENSEFIPADGVTLMSDSARDGFDYSAGKLSLSTSLGDSKAEVYLENMSLNHSFSDDGFTITVSGTWGLGSTLAYKEEEVSEIPLGKVRIYGVGVISIKLSLSMGMEMSSNLSGTFTAGASALSGGTIRAIHEFSVSNCSITGKGSIIAALKVSAGVDIVVAQAVVYGEVGVKTQYTEQTKKNSNDKTIHCQDFKHYLFLTVGADLSYYAFWSGEMESLVGKEFPLADENNSPFILQLHWENGVSVGSCSMGMKVADLQLGGTTAITDGSLSVDSLVLQL